MPRHFGERLSSYKVPARIVFRSASEFPLTATGKVQKHVLRERARRVARLRPPALIQAGQRQPRLHVVMAVVEIALGGAPAGSPLVQKCIPNRALRTTLQRGNRHFSSLFIGEIVIFHSGSRRDR